MADLFEALSEVVAANILLDAITTSRRLTELGVPHTLIGALAVGMHGHPRTRKDVDFLVGPEAFESTSPLLAYRSEPSDVVRIGVIDLLSVPPEYPSLAEHLLEVEPGTVPIIPVDALILLKLHANRPQDRADVAALLKSGGNAAKVTDYLRDIAPALATRFAELASDDEEDWVTNGF